MTHDDFCNCLSVVGVSRTELADMLGCSVRLTRMWASGRASIPEPVADWLDRWSIIRMAHSDPPPPTAWRRRRVTA